MYSRALKNAFVRVWPSAFRRRVFARIAAPQMRDVVNRSVEPELYFLSQLLVPDRAFYDVGANIGEYLYMARQVLSDDLLYGFEPQPELASRLSALFPKAHIESLAFSDAAGEVEMKIPFIAGRPYTSRASIERMREEGEDGSMYLVVPRKTLDSYRAAAGRAAGCLKIDVEGHEAKVLAGAFRTIAEDRPNIIIEIEQRHHTEPIQAIFELILQQGYVGRFFDATSGAVLPLSSFSTSLHQNLSNFKTGAYSNNFVFTSVEREVELVLPSLLADA